jgi:hypothetical protein
MASKLGQIPKASRAGCMGPGIRRLVKKGTRKARRRMPIDENSSVLEYRCRDGWAD